MWLLKKKKKSDAQPSWQSALFARDREEIAEALLDMAQKAVALAGDALDCLASGDEERAKAVVARDAEVDELEVVIEDLCLGALALRQPVREDLRFVFSTLKTITDLERVGDQGVNIARRVKAHGQGSLPKICEEFGPMMSLAQSMVTDAVAALVNDDADLAQDVVRRDDQVDRYQRQIYGSLVDELRRHADSDLLASEITALIIISRVIERIGDHGANIAERAYFAHKGTRLGGEEDANEHR